jgi:hypothetical protein
LRPIISLGLVKSLLKHYNNNLSVPFNIIPMAFVINFEDRNWESDILTFTEVYNCTKPEKLK